MNRCSLKPGNAMMRTDDKSSKLEQFCTIKEAADAIGARDWQVRRAVNRGLIPHYQPFSSRKLVRLSDVLAVIEASRKGGE